MLQKSKKLFDGEICNCKTDLVDFKLKENMIPIPYTVTSREKGGTTRTRAHRQACTLPNPEALGPEIEEGAVNRRPLQALVLLHRGDDGPDTSPAPSSYILHTTLEGCRTNSDLQEQPPSRSSA